MGASNLLLLHLFLFSLVGCTDRGGISLKSASSQSSGTNNSSNVSLAATRTSGVAPLAVIFDASGTTDSSTTKPFHDLEYTWNFGDNDTTTWSNGTRPGINKRNRASGPIAAHVFETAGSYEVTLSVFNGTDTLTKNITITVTNPDEFFSGGRTVCISNSTAVAGMNGCPIGAQVISNTSDFATALNTCIGTEKRCLFKRGDNFVANSSTIISLPGPMLIGAYGSGNAPIISSTNIGGVINLSNTNANDIRIMDLDIIGSGATDSGIGVLMGMPISFVTLLRLSLHEIGKGVSITSSGISASAMVDCHIYNFYNTSGNGFFGRATSSAFLGNHIGPSFGEHLFRLQRGQRVVIANNTFSTPNVGKTALTLRGDPHTTSADDSFLQYVSDNHLENAFGAPGIASVAPSSPNATDSNEYIYDIILERNKFVTKSTDSPPQTALGITAARVTVRNNIFDLTIGTNYRTAISIGANTVATIPNPDSNSILNNTIYGSSPGGSSWWAVSLAGISNPVTNTTIKNNLAYAPSESSNPLFLMQSGTVTGTNISNNSSNAQIKSGPNPFISQSPSQHSDFQLAPNSYATGSGALVPVYFDFFRIQRTTFDLGAIKN